MITLKFDLYRAAQAAFKARPTYENLCSLEAAEHAIFRAFKG